MPLPLLLLLAAAAPADPSARVDALVRQYVHDDGPGMAVLVLKDGKAVHKKGYGLADLAKKTPKLQALKQAAAKTPQEEGGSTT